jgi:hypothetical protein
MCCTHCCGRALKEAGAIVPENFNDFVSCIRLQFEQMVCTPLAFTRRAAFTTC